MSEVDLRQQLAQAQDTIQSLQEDLNETNTGFIALTLEFEQRVDQRTAELRQANEQLQQEIYQRQQAQEALRVYAQRLETLRQIDQAILEARSPREIACASVGNIRNLTPCQQASVAEFDINHGEACVLAIDLDGEIQPASGQHLTIENFGDAETLKQGQATIVDDALDLRETTRKSLALLPEGCRSFAKIPMIVQGRLLGTLNIAAREPNVFDESHIKIAKEVADQMAIALQQAHLRQQIERHAQDLERRVEERTAQLQDANQELEAFAYSVSHDLRAPLRAVNGFSRILIEEYAAELSPEIARYLTLVCDGAQEMGQLIDDLLDFSRLGRASLEKRLVEPADLVRQVLKELEPENEERQVEVNIGRLPSCQADPSLLKQVFVNLLSNALKFTRDQPQARIEVGYTTEREGDFEKGEIAYYIRDNGVGFDMRYANKLFKVFQRLHRAEDYEGTGVGLAIVHRIVHRHGGRVWAEAEIGKGATFYFTL